MTEVYSTAEPSADESAKPVFKHASSSTRWRSFDKIETRKDALLQTAIGREVRSTRTQHRITVVEFTTVAGTSVSMLSKVENGGISPSLDTLQALSSALGVTRLRASQEGLSRTNSPALYRRHGQWGKSTST